MRKHRIWLSFVLLLLASNLSAQANRLKVCVSQDGEGNDALRLARELSARKLDGGPPLTIVAITEKALSAEEEHKLTDSATPFVRILLTEKTAETRSARLESLGCDYNIKVWYHESADNFDANSPAGLPSPSPGLPSVPLSGDRTTVSYELRKAGNKRVLARASAPPLTVFVRQGRRVFNPYSLFADQIIKKFNSLKN
jgi:hypothetical protein